MSTITSTNLAPGLKLHVIADPKFKSTTVKVFVQRPLDQRAAMTALLPNVLQRGSSVLPTALDLERRLEEYYGASFNTAIHKVGERHIIEFSLRLVNERFLGVSEVNVFSQAVGFLQHIINQPLAENGSFNHRYVEQEKNALMRLINSLYNDKDYWAHKRCIEETCQGEPYSIFVYGNVRDLPQISAADLYRFYLETMSTAPIDVFVVGAVDPVRVEEAVWATLKFRRETLAELPAVSVEHPTAGGREVIEEEEVNQGKLVISLRTNTSCCDADFPALLYYNSILGGGTFSKLFVNVREKHSLAYYAHSKMEQVKGLMFISAGIDPRRFQDAVSLIREQLDLMRQGAISNEEFRQARSALLSALRARADTPRGIIGYYLQGLVAGCPKTTTQQRKAIMNVSTADIERVAHKVKLDTIYFMRHPESQGVR